MSADIIRKYPAMRVGDLQRILNELTTLNPAIEKYVVRLQLNGTCDSVAVYDSNVDANGKGIAGDLYLDNKP